MKTITNAEAWAELSSAQTATTGLSEQLYQFHCRATEDNSAEGAMLCDVLSEVRHQLEDVRRRLRLLSNYYTD